MKDYYSILGVDRDTPVVAIKAAYRRLARAHHPDLVTERDTAALREAGLRMRDINEAYAVLRSEQRRREYEDFSHGRWAGNPNGSARAYERPAGAQAHQGPTAPQGQSANRAPSPPRAAPPGTVSPGVLDGLVAGFVEKLGNKMQSDSGPHRLSPAHLEGFRSAFRGKIEGSRYTVAIQTHTQLDSSKANEFLRAAMTAMEKDRSPLRPSVYLLVLAYASCDDLETVVKTIRRLPTGAKRLHERDDCVVAIAPALGGQAVVFGNAVKSLSPLRAIIGRLLPAAAVH